MRDAQPKVINLKDYCVPDFLIDRTELIIDLTEVSTTVTSTLYLRRNPEANNQHKLVLMGQELKLVSLAIDGQLLDSSQYQLTEESLTLVVPDQCQLTCVTQIKPQDNTSLEGLYKSSGMYCTQCEAEGFRKITYYLDRPDIMSVFTTTLVADKELYPILLSNGNCIETGEVESGRHWAKWHDPFKKPAYLFALVAGDLECQEDHFTTQSGRKIRLQIFVEAKDLNKCDHAMTSLKNAMAWDEKVYGREYDLDIFMIVAVDDFNMGAMENKGLNIFNTSCVLANQATTTDVGFQRVEGVVAHEYFHNWSGNRVTCRDWFQLSLKEGFTVFRDQSFSADMGSHTVKRVEDVTLLRTLQFAEDAGPMAHPVQPPSFIEISNFYTLTVYEKGSEIVRMLHTLLGEEQFRAGSDLYFERHDGQAVTIDEFIDAMATVSGRDLGQFKRWYTQAGTPLISVCDHYNEDEQRYKITFTQTQPDTPESKGNEKQPLHMPIAMGLVGDAGCLALHPKGTSLVEQADNTHWIFEFKDAETTLEFEQVLEKPVPSLLRNFSAPVKLVANYNRDDLLRLMMKDSDGFNRWDASQQLAVSIIEEQVKAYLQLQTAVIDRRIIKGYEAILADPCLDPAMIALMLELPSEAYLSEIADVVYVEAIHHSRRALRVTIAQALHQPLWDLYQSLSTVESEEFQIDADSIARRSLKNIALAYIMLLDNEEYHQACLKQCHHSSNMTDTMAALTALVHSNFPQLEDEKESALAAFYQRWENEALVVNHWLSLQASIPQASTLTHVRHLMEHPGFSITNPNKIRALIGRFCQNNIGFHQASGAGHQFLAEQVSALNSINPQIAARLLTPLTRWKKYPQDLQQSMLAALNSVLEVDDLSKDVYEVVTKSLVADKAQS